MQIYISVGRSIDWIGPNDARTTFPQTKCPQIYMKGNSSEETVTGSCETKKMDQIQLKKKKKNKANRKKINAKPNAIWIS